MGSPGRCLPPCTTAQTLPFVFLTISGTGPSAITGCFTVPLAVGCQPLLLECKLSEKTGNGLS